MHAKYTPSPSVHALSLACFAGSAVEVGEELRASWEASILPATAAVQAALLPLVACLVQAACLPAVGAPAQLCQPAQLQLQPARVERDLEQGGPAAVQLAALRAAHRHRLHPGRALLQLQLLQRRRLPAQHLLHSHSKGMLHRVWHQAAQCLSVCDACAASYRRRSRAAKREGDDKVLQATAQLARSSQALQ